MDFFKKMFEKKNNSNNSNVKMKNEKDPIVTIKTNAYKRKTKKTKNPNNRVRFTKNIVENTYGNNEWKESRKSAYVNKTNMTNIPSYANHVNRVRKTIKHRNNTLRRVNGTYSRNKRIRKIPYETTNDALVNSNNNGRDKLYLRNLSNFMNGP